MPMLEPQNASNDRPMFAIVGGGISGVVQAIYLAEKYPSLNIVIFEKNEDFLTGTSAINPGRPSLGFHYQDLPTATFCQDNTVNFTKFLERIKCPTIFADAPQMGIYVLMKDSLSILGETIRPIFRPDELEGCFEKIRHHAIDKYSNDEDFKRHFGHPEAICRKLDKVEYEPLLTQETLKGVGACYETSEKTFNIPGICSYLREYVKKFKNIKVLTGAIVTHIEKPCGPKDKDYRITWGSNVDDRTQVSTAQFLTLACWERVGHFLKQLNRENSQPTHNRLKMLGIIEIDMEKARPETIRPIFVASGAFSMISPQVRHQLRDGRLVCDCACTLAIRTNVMASADDVPLPADYVRKIEGNMSLEERLDLAKPILEGAKGIFACMKDARLVDARFGTVRVPFGSGKNINIHAAASEHHSRADHGFKALGDRLFINEAMKVIYAVHNAELAAECIQSDVTKMIGNLKGVNGGTNGI
ncbi:hypothetical protein QQS21_005653 [Conoideocrella luteorostrata]|uniref:FAD dependent oxidoreductase domain-containing protein n=1 Tax=Conoideocrella luteorostrata TaxID=1105319 RepID=A0AAJ0FYU1_9HYPO|nr:hypothetical protein QQS21_005653 [Conoideocrella luteorostrata]